MTTAFIRSDPLVRNAPGCDSGAAIATPAFERFAGKAGSFDTQRIGNRPCVPARRKRPSRRLTGLGYNRPGHVGAAAMSEGVTDRWASGDLYEPYVGRWSRLVARKFLAWLDAPAGLTWLDVGCGTGALSEAIARSCAPERLAGIDPSAGFLDFARQRLEQHDAEFRQADARDLPFAAAEFDRVVSGLVLNFVPDPPRATAEMLRVVRPGGEVALYVWDYAGRMELMRCFWDAAAALDPRAGELDEGKRFPICRPAALRRLFAAAGLATVATRAIDVPTVFRDFDDYWTPFLGGQGPAPGYCMSLAEDSRVRLRERLRATLPVRPDGSIHLIARALAVRGRKA